MANYIKSGEIKYISISDVLPNHSQPRSIFNDKPLSELADSIRTHGVLEPVLVVKEGLFYKIIAGERRYRAARMAGLLKIPAIIISASPEQLSEIAIIENSHRQQLNPMEEAKAIKALMERSSLTQEQVALGLGRSRPAVANLLRLLSLPEPIQNMVREGKLSQGHARVLLSIKDEKSMIVFAEKCIENKWSVYALTQEIEKSATANSKPKKGNEKQQTVEKPKRVSPELENMVLDMERVFQMPIKLSGNDKKGKLVLEYSSEEELEVIYDIIQKLKK